MADITAGRYVAPTLTASETRRVIFASSLGTVFEWYDFYIYGTLAAILAAKFFSRRAPTAAFIFTLLAFAAGFVVRPFGALVFGRLGDLVGRKYTFLVTMTLMGIGTFLIGLLPTYASMGHRGADRPDPAPPVPGPRARRRIRRRGDLRRRACAARQARLLHLVDPDHRDARPVHGDPRHPRHPHLAWARKSFTDWGWRIPFLLSAVLLAVSIWIRLSLDESPMFQQMKDEGRRSKAPLTEAFGTWANAKIAILALLGATAGEAVVWYGGQFYALFFLTQTLKVPAVNAQIMIAIALVLGTPFFIVFGWLSDKIGRKPIMLAGFLLAAVTYFPIFQGITHFANPALDAALASSPVTVVADPADCSFQLKLTGTEKYTSSCDVAKAALVAKSVNYDSRRRRRPARRRRSRSATR